MDLVVIGFGLIIGGLAGKYVFEIILGHAYYKKNKLSYSATDWFLILVSLLISFILFIIIPLMGKELAGTQYPSIVYLPYFPIVTGMVYGFLAKSVSRKEADNYKARNYIIWLTPVFVNFNICWKKRESGWLIYLSSWLIVLVGFFLFYISTI
ncbi:MAG: hypothetical protein Q7S37_02085 [bacterium]|nr:hypothetical protein [bacterium]